LGLRQPSKVMKNATSVFTRAWGRAGEAAMAGVRQACEQFGSAGRSLAPSASASDRSAPPLIDLD
jgi:hypothetical protein